MSENIAALILAAGSSSRMGEGRHKLLLPLGEMPVLAHVLMAVRESQARPVMVVLGYQAEQIREALKSHVALDEVTFVENPDYPQGMSTSLRAGLASLQHYEPVGGAIVLLGDQPLITARLIDDLIAARQATGSRIIAPLYNGRRGNPVLFDASLFPELEQVDGDEGGRSVIERHHQDMATIEVVQSTARYDVDTWEAYQQVVEEWQRQQR
ncbi:MAG: nucleotidyltransferase family protein [Ktedonobacteraceae bacterium]|nr:nucleotidyltransferase family protein [Ktedonobacteraceae bacterium]